MLDDSRRRVQARIIEMQEALKVDEQGTWGFEWEHAWNLFWLQVEKEEKLLRKQQSKDRTSFDKSPTADEVQEQLLKVADELEGFKGLDEEEGNSEEGK